MNAGRLIGVVVGVMLLVAGATGIPVMPHRWVGMSTATLVGWAMVLTVPALVVALLLVVLDRMVQLKRHLAANTRLLERALPRGKVVQGPWRRSG